MRTGAETEVWASGEPEETRGGATGAIQVPGFPSLSDAQASVFGAPEPSLGELTKGSQRAWLSFSCLIFT